MLHLDEPAARAVVDPLLTDHVQARGAGPLLEAERGILEYAVEAWAARSNGEYPNDLSDINQDADTVVDLLPDGQLLVNPYHGAFTEPVDGAAVQWGETGYVVSVDGLGFNAGYVISGWGWCGAASS